MMPWPGMRQFTSEPRPPVLRVRLARPCGLTGAERDQVGGEPDQFCGGEGAVALDGGDKDEGSAFTERVG